MTKSTRLISIAAIITSPWWVGFLSFYIHAPKELAGFSVIFAVIYGIPLIAVVGLLFSFLFRHKPNADKLSLVSYLVPAILVVSCEIFALYIY